MPKQTKNFKPHPTHPIRMADKTWKQLKDKKIRSGLSWNLFMLKLLKENGTK